MSDFERMTETMKTAAGALRDADVPFVLGGGLAAWARGGGESDHDVDFLVKPEGWLVKAYDDDVLIDLIYEPATGRVTDEVIERGEEREVLSTRMRVMALEDIMVTKLLALDETHLDFSSPLDIARPLREQIDWDEVRERTQDSPYARAFFTLVEALGIVEPASVG